ncbi:alpha/beta hydrolase [Kitasatospora camelliae]|uniref:Alpha/beta hydrolase n=1 Tax=Kitasatospora camelliae TaxID=3156397 RepID=A0AAU8JTN2_9ACTN
MAEEVVVTTGIGYGSGGQVMDVYRPAGAPEPVGTVLLWHGRGPDERDVLAPIARATAALGVLVLVPDWRPDAPDGGRRHLAESAAFARRNTADLGGDPGRITLAGWSLGGKAAVAVGLDPDGFDGWRPHAVVGVAGAYGTPAPSTGSAPLEVLGRDGGPVPPVPVWLVHGTADPVVDAERSRELHAALGALGRPVSLTEVATDHAGVVMTEYSPAHDRCLPGTADHALRAGARTARVLAEAAGRRS